MKKFLRCIFSHNYVPKNIQHITDVSYSTSWQIKRNIGLKRTDVLLMCQDCYKTTVKSIDGFWKIEDLYL